MYRTAYEVNRRVTVTYIIHWSTLVNHNLQLRQMSCILLHYIVQFIVVLFADDLVICEHSREEVELQLERWRETFESHGLRVSRGKTEYMPCPEKDQTIYIQEQEVKPVKTFKYLGSMFDANGGAENDVNNRVKIAWSKWRETTGVMCDRNIPTKLKDKVYKTAIKPAMVYGAECWAVRKKEERKLHTTEMRMQRWARGKTRYQKRISGKGHACTRWRNSSERRG